MKYIIVERRYLIEGVKEVEKTDEVFNSEEAAHQRVKDFYEWLEQVIYNFDDDELEKPDFYAIAV